MRLLISTPQFFYVVHAPAPALTHEWARATRGARVGVRINKSVCNDEPRKLIRDGSKNRGLSSMSSLLDV